MRVRNIILGKAQSKKEAAKLRKAFKEGLYMHTNMDMFSLNLMILCRKCMCIHCFFNHL